MEPISPKRIALRAPGEAYQVVRSDKAGKIYLLTTSLELFSVEPPTKIEAIAQIQSDELAHRGALPALSPDGKSWLFAGEGGGAFLIEGARATPLPKPPLPADFLGFAGGDPVIGARLSPVSLMAYADEGWRREPPQLLRLAGSEWEPFGGRLRAEGRSEMALVVDASVLVASDGKGRTWVADEYQYRVRRFSSGGRKLLEVRDPGRIAPDEVDTAREQEFAAQVAKAHPNRQVETFAAPESVIRALADASGDALLLVDLLDGKVALDRIDSATGDVSRVELKIADAARVRTIAAGVDGVVFANARTIDGMYFVTWEVLEPRWTRASGPKVEGSVQADTANR